jgi:hypothetical protein
MLGKFLQCFDEYKKAKLRKEVLEIPDTLANSNDHYLYSIVVIKSSRFITFSCILPSGW